MKKICEWNAVLGVKGYQQVYLPWTPLHFCPVKSLNSLLEGKLEIATFSSAPVSAFVPPVKPGESAEDNLNVQLCTCTTEIALVAFP